MRGTRLQRWLAAALAAACVVAGGAARAQTLRWHVVAPATILFTPTVNGDGSVYFATDDGHIRAVSPSGALLWGVDPGGLPSTAMALSGSILYFGTSQQELAAYGIDGHRAWRLKLDGDIRGVPAVAPDGTVYVGTTGETFFAVSPAGTILWSYRTNGPVLQSAAVAHAGFICVASQTTLYALDPGGGLIWSRALPSHLATPMAFDDQDDVYYVDGAGTAWSLDAGGKKRWMAPGSTTQDTSSGSPVVSATAVFLNAVLSTPPPATYSISGAVTTVGGGALQGATVTATTSSSGGTSPSATTDSSGNYTISGLADGTYTLTPTLSGYAFTPSTLSVTVSGANVTGQNFTASTGFSISGTVTLASGGALAGVTVATTGVSATTDSNGAYVLSPLPTGTYIVTPAMTGYTFTPASLTVVVTTYNVSGQNFTAAATAMAKGPSDSASVPEDSSTTYQFGAYGVADGAAVWPAVSFGSSSAPALDAAGTLYVPSAADDRVILVDASTGATAGTIKHLAGAPSDMVLADTTAGPRLYLAAGGGLYCYGVPSGPDGASPWAQVGAGPRHLFRRDDAPEVQMTAPAAGASVSGAVALSADVQDDFPSGMTVRFLVDGVSTGSVSGPPYAGTWYSQAAADGSHLLAVEARDSAGNVRADSVTVTSSNGSAVLEIYPDTPPVPFSWEAGSETRFRAEFALAADFGSLVASSKRPEQPWLTKAWWRPDRSTWDKVLRTAKDNPSAPTEVFWRVVGKTDGAVLAHGTLQISPALACVPQSPPDGGTVSASQPPVLAWEASHNDGFRVEVSDSADFSSGVRLSSKRPDRPWLHQASWTPPAKAWKKLARDASALYWRVAARDSIGRKTTGATSALIVTP